MSTQPDTYQKLAELETNLASVRKEIKDAKNYGYDSIEF